MLFLAWWLYQFLNVLIHLMHEMKMRCADIWSVNRLHDLRAIIMQLTRDCVNFTRMTQISQIDFSPLWCNQFSFTVIFHWMIMVMTMTMTMTIRKRKCLIPGLSKQFTFITVLYFQAGLKVILLPLFSVLMISMSYWNEMRLQQPLS